MLRRFPCPGAPAARMPDRPGRGRAGPRAATKLWQGRLPGRTSPAVERYTSSVEDDRRLGVDDVDGSLAHAAMLREIGVLSAAEHRVLQRALRRIRAEFADGHFGFAATDEDVHSAVERRLFELAGEPAGRLHTGRSRNDQVATDLRLYTRRVIAELANDAAALQEVLLRRAEQHRDTPLPGYTHGQRAQVVSLAHHLLAYIEMLQRDVERLADARARADVLPLGSGALAGSTLPLRRSVVARALGFGSVASNSIDAVSDRDFVVETVAACALLMIHVSRLCEDLVIWSSSESGFVELDDSHSTGSSLMPHKKNPDVLELARARCGRVSGNLMTLLTVLKGIPLAYDRDLQEVKHPLFEAVDTVSSTLRVLAEVLSAARFNEVAMSAAASDPELYATDLAEHLVRKGVPFRTAHEIVARAVSEAKRKGATLGTLSAREWRRISPHFADPAGFFDPHSALQRRVTAGGPGPRSVALQLTRARRLIERTRRLHGGAGPQFRSTTMLDA
jgi:argininosuccinate lyase